jgi:uncharacterized membrane protein
MRNASANRAWTGHADSEHFRAHGFGTRLATRAAVLKLGSLSLAQERLHAIDWMRGLVMLLMVVDHASGILNPARMMPDSMWIHALGMNLTPGGSPWQFLTRWMTHLCAPTFIFLAGTSLALSSERRRAQGASWREIDRHVIVRGALLVAFEVWMAIAFGSMMFQVLYALGAGMIAMVLLRRVPPRVLLVASVAWILVGEAATSAAGIVFGAEVPLWAGPFLVPSMSKSFIFGIGGGFLYPLLGWLPVMILGWVYGRHLQARPGLGRVLPLLGFAAAALGVFAVQRLVNGYGNFGLARTDGSILRWLQVSKYPPSLAYLGLELGILFVVLAVCFAVARRRAPRSTGPLLVFGQTALFFYLVHIHLLRLVGIVATGGYGKPAWPLAASYAAALGALAVLYPLCRWYRTFKSRHPLSLARFV